MERHGQSGVEIGITVLSGGFVKIHDSIKSSQNLYIKLVRSFADASETDFARSATCQQGNLEPKWNEHFTFQRWQDVKLKFQVFAEHYWRKDCFCGEAEIDMTSLLLQIQLGLHNNSNPCEVQLWKKGLPTGKLRVTFDLDVESNEAQGTLPSGPKLQALLNEPMGLEKTLRAWFRLIAQPIGRGGACVARPSDMAQVAELLAAKLEVPPIDFSATQLMFSKFQVTEEPLLYIDEAVKMIDELVRLYQKSVAPSGMGEDSTHDFKNFASALLLDFKKHAAWLTGEDTRRDIKTVAGEFFHDGKKHAKHAARLMRCDKVAFTSVTSLL